MIDHNCHLRFEALSHTVRTLLNVLFSIVASARKAASNIVEVKDTNAVIPVDQVSPIYV